MNIAAKKSFVLLLLERLLEPLLSMVLFRLHVFDWVFLCCLCKICHFPSTGTSQKSVQYLEASVEPSDHLYSFHFTMSSFSAPGH